MGFSLNPLHDISSALHNGERLADKALHLGENTVEDSGKAFDTALKDAAKVVSNMSPSQLGHTALDIVGMVPVVGTVANLANAGWYAAQGDWADAAWSAAAAIPVEGDLADAAKLGKDAVEIGEDGEEAGRAVEEGAEVARTKGNEELSGNEKKILGELASRAGEKIADVILSRGGKGANVREVGHWAQKTLGQAAKTAAKKSKDPNEAKEIKTAKKAIKIAKDARRLGEKH